MTHIERSPKTPPRIQTGPFATFYAFLRLRRRGSGAPSSGSRRRRLGVPAALFALTIVLAVGVVLALGAAGADGEIRLGEFPPSFGNDGCLAASHTSIVLFVLELETEKKETHWSFEYATSASGPWTAVPGASGTITQAEAESASLGHVKVQAEWTGLTPEVLYHVRVTATNANGTASEEVPNQFKEKSCEALPLRPEPVVGDPSVVNGGGTGIANVAATSAHVYGRVDPRAFETHWRFEYATSASGTWTPAAGAEGTISQAEAGATHKIEGDLTGLSPDTTYYVRLFAESEPEWPEGSGEREHKEAISGHSPAFETLGSATVTTFAVHAIHGEAMRALGEVNPHGFEAVYHFEYVTREHFEKEGFANAGATPEVKGSGVVGQDLPGLQSGVIYRYRLLATNTFPGSRVAEGEDQTLTVPASTGGEEEACPNAQFRTGPSARLPDCRAYEQVTPVDKEGAREIFSYGSGIGIGALVGEDGEHLLLEAPTVNWGSGASAGQSPYSFSRDPEKGWRMTSASPQPETGVDNLVSQIFNPDVTQFGFNFSYFTSPQSQSPHIEFKVGPPGGPYTTVASVPRGQVGGGGSNGWVAASEDFGKLILQVEDHTLPGFSTGTTQGSDVYEYSAGRLRQANVGIGICGANVAHGRAASRHAVSADGSRVFFEAVPGSNCEAPEHLYMRVNGAETVDVGPYKFLGANAEGTKVVLEKEVPHEGEEATREFLLYDTGTATAKPVFSTHEGRVSYSIHVSEDLTAIYFSSKEQLTPEAPPPSSAEDIYRYDILAERLRFVVQGGEGAEYVSPDGRYFYFEGGVSALPAGGSGRQVFRYDSVEDVVQCMSCASPFSPEPKLLSTFDNGEGLGRGENIQNGVPNVVLASANGDFVFFDTPAALVPQDVDGEVAPEPGVGRGVEHHNDFYSPSSDVYEWRKQGVDGCVHVQGCLGLITSGRGGYLNLLLGTTASGRDVFIYTSSQLVSQDNDTAGDIYDVRIGGGFPPPPPRPVECEGAACSTPSSPPVDVTPSSFTFTGAGNLVPSSSAKPAVKTKKHKARKKGSRKKRGRKRGRKAAERRGKAKKSARRVK